MRKVASAAITFSAVAPVLCQHAGVVKDNYLLPLPIQSCTKANGCTEEATTVTMDANWRWIHEYEGYANCYKDSEWSAEFCPTGAECSSNCALDGVSESAWPETYGVSQVSDGVKLQFKTGSNVGSRFYMMDTPETYKLFKLKNREITFDVDVSKLPCGINGAVYFSEMPADGGKSATNSRGANYGTGYCDAQCPRDVKFIDGEANSEEWHEMPDGRSLGKYGSCCAEMDLWEADNVAAAYTAHPCSVDELHRCEGMECKTTCDMSGCDFNSYRMGDHEFYGPGSNYALNALKPFTLVTQFITADETDEGDLVEIRRFYVQDGKKIDNSKATWPGLQNHSSLTDDSCSLDKQLFGDENTFAKFGGMKQMGESLDRGMVLVLSLWDDMSDHMLWLDSAEPRNESLSKPGVARGPCSRDSGDPAEVRRQYPDSWVEYSNFKYGEIGSTEAEGGHGRRLRGEMLI